MNKLGECHAVIATLHAHVATEAGPDRLILRALAIVPQPSLCYETWVKLRVVLGNWAYNRALTTVKAEAYIGINYLSFFIEHLGVVSSPS